MRVIHRAGIFAFTDPLTELLRRKPVDDVPPCKQRDAQGRDTGQCRSHRDELEHLKARWAECLLQIFEQVVKHLPALFREGAVAPLYCSVGRAPNAMATSARSSNEMRLSPIIWWGACPWPASGTAAPGRADTDATQLAARRSTTQGARPGEFSPRRMSFMIASGSSVLGLSLVTITWSANVSAIDPMTRRFEVSRLPPQPKTHHIC